MKKTVNNAWIHSPSRYSVPSFAWCIGSARILVLIRKALRDAKQMRKKHKMDIVFARFGDKHRFFALNHRLRLQNGCA
ncbi:MAG: hypothetical protein ACERKO_10250 [Acetanaerobacterium sp.]